MRYILFFTIALWALPVSAEIRAGRAAVKITPSTGTPMAGYYNIRLMSGVHDDIHAKAIVLESGGQKAALVACDLISLSPDVIEKARKAAERATGIPASNIMISATHTHTGPVITRGSAREGAFGGDLPLVKQYMLELPDKIAESVKLANADLKAAVMLAGAGSEGSVAFNRRFVMKDGSVGWNAGKQNPNIVRAAGPIDPSVPVVYFETPGGEPIATYVNYTMHLDTVGGLDVSSDYPFTIASILGRVKGPGMLTMFTIGTAGNINHIDVSTKTPQKGHGEAARLGTTIAGEVVKTYAKLSPVDGRISARSEVIKLGLPQVTPADVDTAKRIADQVGKEPAPKFLETVQAFKALDVAARDGRAYEAEVQVIAAGRQIAWVALPGEVFVELGLAIKQASPFPLTIVTELANGPVSYIPDRRAYAQGNYEPVSARVAPGSGEALVETAVKLLQSAYEAAN